MNAGIRRAEQGYDQIKTHRNKTEAQIDEEIAKKQKELKNSIRDNATDEQQQRKALENAKQSELTKIKQYTQKLADGEFTEPEPIKLRKKDAELIALEKKRSIIEEQYRKKQHELQEKNKSTFEVVADFVRSTYVALLIGAPKTLLKVGSMSLLRPLSEAGTKATLGKVFNSFFPNISKVAERGGEGASNAVLKKGFEAYLSTFGEKRMQALADKAAKEYDIARDAYVEHGESNNPNAAKLEELKAKMNEKLIKVQGSFVYNFIGGSAFKDALNALVNRTNEIEKQFGKVESESINDAYLKDSNKSMKRQILEGELNEFKYVLGFIGRSHSALKTFSGRFSFAAGFMARLEGAVKNGEDIISTPKIIEIAHESYLDWERGKYQQSNWISDKWNSLINHLEKGEIGKGLVYSKIAKYILQSDVAITRVPVNILHEAVMEYTLGAFRVAGAFGGDASIPKLMGRLKGELKADGITKDMPEFKAALKDKINQMDEKQAATIARCFRKGGIGVGLYALALISGAIHFGIFPHLGQKKKKEEADLKPDELNPGQVMVGNNKLGEVTSGIIEHIPALWPMFMGLGMAQTYHDDIMKGKSIPAATGDAIYTHLKVVEGGIPQSKVFTATGIQQEVQKIVEKRAKDLGIIEDGTYQGITELTKNYIKDQHLNIHKPSLRQGDPSKPKFEPQDKYNIYVEERAKRIEDGINQLKEKGLYSKATDKEGLQLALDDMIEKANADAKFKAFGISEEKPKRREVINTYSPLPIEQ